MTFEVGDRVVVEAESTDRRPHAAGAPQADTLTTVQANDLLEAAQAGDDEAFGRLVEPHRGELHAHCYRMLGSLHDADDALQDALLRAWRALRRFEGRSSLRTWLFTITTNACLEAIRRRSKRVLPLDVGSPADPHAPFEPPVTEDSQQAVLRDVGDDGVRELVDRYVEAWERCDVDAFVGLLAEEVAVAMPPLPMWYAGVDAVRVWAETSSMSGEWRWEAPGGRPDGHP